MPNAQVNGASVPWGYPSYRAGVSALALAASATDIFTISGSPKVTTAVVRLWISGSATAAAPLKVSIIKRSAANTGGTATNPSFVSADSNDKAAQSVAAAYTANPGALGTAVGTLMTIDIPIGTATAPSNPVPIDLTMNGMKPIVLRDVSDVLAINLAGATYAGGVVSITAEIMESGTQ
jgi:hypothetical protein